MVNVNEIVNKRYSLRQIDDEKFEVILPELASEISKMSFHTSHSEDSLRKDWLKLIKWRHEEDHINSTSRIGMKLCEHFFPNFFDIQSKKGDSFTSLWNQENLMKILRWNRKSHSTPYMSELRRGVYFCCGLPKSTMYRPQMMKLACMKYSAKNVLDPCAGWGGRMLGAVSAGCHYYAFEPNTKTYDNLMRLVKFLNLESKVTIYCDDARNMLEYDIPKVDLVLTSPPYFDLEIYTNEDTQSVSGQKSYDLWSQNFLSPVIEKSLSFLTEGGVSCWNVGKVGKYDMNDDIVKYHSHFNFSEIDRLCVISSKRQVHQTTQFKNSKNSDDTVIFRHDTRRTM